MPNYQNGQIYSIRCRSNEDLIYVGSTTQKLSTRIAQHRRQAYKHAKKLYECTDGNWEDWYIELYEDFPCDNKKDLDKREGEVIRLIGTLNKNIPGRTREEYNKDNKDNIKEYTKTYYQRPDVISRIDNNKEDKREYDKKYRDINILKRTENGKLYYEDNKGKINERARIWRLNNKDKVKEYNQKKKMLPNNK